MTKEKKVCKIKVEAPNSPDTDDFAALAAKAHRTKRPTEQEKNLICYYRK